jgi:hypothetical protein
MESRCQFVLSPRCFDDIFGRQLKVVDVHMSWGRLVINVEGIGYPVLDPDSVLIKEFNSLTQLRNWIGGQSLNGGNGSNQIHNSQPGGSKRHTSGSNAIQRR